MDGATRCARQTWQRCQNGDWRDQQVCVAICVDALGCAQCDPSQSTTICQIDTVYNCNSDGTLGSVVSPCQSPQFCVAGVCQDPCAMAAKEASYIGCEYWPVDLDNGMDIAPVGSTGCDATYTPASLGVCYNPSVGGEYEVRGLCDYGNDCSGEDSIKAGYACVTMNVCAHDSQHSAFAIVVANPSPDTPADVTLQNSAGMSMSVTIAPGQVQSLFPQKMGFPNQSLHYSGIESKAYKLTSTLPIAAYQFNPLDNVGVFSNDASLLIPVSTYDKEYLALAYPTATRRPWSGDDWNGFVTVVASGPGTTTVTITPTAGVRQGINVPALPAGSPYTFTLNQFETLNLESVEDGDLSGTKISASQPVGVFTGHQSTIIDPPGVAPGDHNCCADHLEDQLFPLSTWGKAYAIARSQRRIFEPDLLRIMAQTPGTTVTFNPPVSGCSGTLDAGQFCEVWISGDTEVTGSNPILVGHLLASVGQFGKPWLGNPGDPSLGFSVPTEQFRTRYQLLVPSQYKDNYFSLVTAAGGTVKLDGTDVSAQLASFGSGMFVGGRVLVSAGPHVLDCPQSCGVEVYGYDEAVSYLFPGGLDLKPFNPM
jgi:hypothetical protein